MERIKAACQYKKLVNEKIKIIILKTGYFIIDECIKFFSMLGHKVKCVKITKDDNFLRNLLFSICEFKPDFIFTINHLGFDEEGKLSQILTEINIPFAVWYVDSPRYILKHNAKNNATDLCFIFVFEKSYIDWLKEVGFNNSYYLPLATDNTIFKPIPIEKNVYRNKLSFVGNSMVSPVNDWWEKIKDIEGINEIENTIFGLIKNNSIFSSVKLATKNLNIQEEKLYDLESYISLKATKYKRKNILEKLVALPLTIYGDEEWKTILSNVNLFPPVNYYRESPLVYNGSEININITSYQLPTGCNQRVFDVPSCQSFLLTDFTESIYELFSKDEVAVYRTADEAYDLAKFYINHQNEREKIARKARKKVLSAHTYLHRLNTMIDIMKKEWKTLGLG